MDLRIGKSENRARDGRSPARTIVRSVGSSGRRCHPGRWWNKLQAAVFLPSKRRPRPNLRGGVSEDFRMKLPHALCHGSVFSDLGRDDRPARARSRPDLRSELSGLPAGLPGHRGLLLRVPLSNDGAVYGVGFRPLRPMRGQSILRRPEGQAQQAPTLPAILRIGSLRRLTGQRRAHRHSPAVSAERERPRRGLGGSRRVGPQAAPGSFDLGVARAFAARPLLGGGRTVLRHVIAHDRAGNSTQDAGLFACKSGAWTFQDTAPAHTPNVSPCDSPLRIQRGRLSSAHQA